MCLLSRHPFTAAVDPIIGNDPVIDPESAVDQIVTTSHGVDGVVVPARQLVRAGTAVQDVASVSAVDVVRAFRTARRRPSCRLKYRSPPLAEKTSLMSVVSQGEYAFIHRMDDSDRPIG